VKVERSITAARRAAGQTIDEMSKFTAAVLTARRYPHADQVGTQLRSLTPLFNLLLVKRTVGSPALVIQTDDMRIDLHVDYDMNAEENLSVPPMDLLNELPANAKVEVLVQVTEEVAPALAELVSKADGKPALIMLTIVAPEPSMPVDDIPPSPEPAEAEIEEPLPEGMIPQQTPPDEDVTLPV
jgi:hypothetical protein